MPKGVCYCTELRFTSFSSGGYSELTRLKTGKFHHCVLAKKAERQTEIAYLCAEGMSFEQIAFWQGRIRI